MSGTGFRVKPGMTGDEIAASQTSRNDRSEIVL